MAVFVNNADVLKLLFAKWKEQCKDDEITMRGMLTRSDGNDDTILHNACVATQEAAECVTVLLDVVKQEDKERLENKDKEEKEGDKEKKEGDEEKENEADSVDKDLLEEVLLQCNKENNTPLHYASKQGGSKVVSLLLDAIKENRILMEKVIFARNNDGNTAWSLAMSEGKQETADTFLNKLPDDLAEKLKR